MPFSERREAEKRMFESLLYTPVKDIALEDGRASREAALSLARKRRYTEARSRLEDARRCFEWSSGAGKDMKELQRVREELKVQENSARGDHLTEGVASKLHFLSRKDYSKFCKDLSEAASAFHVAQDSEGAQVVRMVTKGLRAVQSAEKSWEALLDALKDRNFADASQYLRRAKRSVLDATKVLPLVSPSLERAAKIMSPAGEVTPLDIVAELAALDGERDHKESIRMLDQGLLNRAQRLNTTAREVLELAVMSCRKNCSNDETSDTRASTASTVCGISVGEEGCDKSKVLSVDGQKTGREDAAIDRSFNLSDEQLTEGKALLFKIRRSTSVLIDSDSYAIGPRSRTSGYPRVRSRVENVLEKVSKVQDAITRRKAVKRGDELMSSFWDLVESASVRAASKMDGINGNDGDSNSLKKNDSVTTSSARAGNINFYENGGDRVNEKHWRVFGGQLDPEAAEECLRLLAEAREVYNEQGFGSEADHANRIYLQIMADRCLARAQMLAHATKAPAVEAAHSASIGGPTDAADAQFWWASGVYDKSRHAGELKAAGVAAREAEEYYFRAGHVEGALRAQRIGISLKGDEAMSEFVYFIQRRFYTGALECMDQARRLYTDAGPAGMQGLERVGDPDGLVKAIAMEDGRRLKAEAIRLLRAGHVERSTETLRRVHLCFSFVDREGLADATADVDAAVLMVRWFASGDATVAAADAALETGASEGAINLLQEAKSFYNRAQSCYDDLVDQVTSLLQARPCDNEAVNMAIELQDNINGIYDSRKDGQRVKRVEFRLDCLAADASLENLAQIVDCEQFEDAHTLLSSAASVYGRSEDHARLSKVNRITLLIRLIEKGKLALDAACFIEAKRTLSDASHERSVLVFEKPVSMHPPDCKLLRDGERGAESLVLSRVRVADDVHGVNAFKLLEQGGHAAAEVEEISSSTRLEWWTRHVGSAAPGAAERAGEIEGVICRAKELRVKKANAVGMAKAEKSSLEERGEKRQGDLDGAAQAFRTAAKLFPTAGLGARAFDARIEAKQTQAEKLVLNVEGFHSGADLEASVESLESAQALLLEASAEMGEVVEEQRHELEDLSLDDIGINDAPPSRLRRQLKEIQDFCSRFAGDSIVRGVVPAMDMQDYDKALCPIRKADGQNGAARLARWLTSAVTSYKVRTGAGPASVPAEEAAVSPEELLVERETLDSARLRAKAAAALEKEKDPAKAQRLLSREVAAMEWAGTNPSMAGATAVARDIKNFEYRKTGDATCRDLVCHLRDGEIERTKEKLAEVLDMYHQGVAFQEVAETRAILSCVDREKDVCSNIVSAVTTGDPAKAVTTPTAASHRLGGKNDDDDNFRELLCQGSEGEVASTTLSQAQHMAHETRRANAVGDHVTNNDGVECSLGSHASPSDSWSGKPAPDSKKEHMENLQNLK